MAAAFAREYGDVQTAVMTLVDGLAPIVPVSEQPNLARKIASVIANRPSTMGDNMFVRQSIIRGSTATRGDVVDGLAAWVTVFFDLSNLQRDRRRALGVTASLPDDALDRLTRALASSRNGCILAVPHMGSIELFAAYLKDRDLNFGVIYTIGSKPTPVERWIYAGRRATLATLIAVGRRSTGAEISKILQNNGVVLMVVDVYPSARYKGISVKAFADNFTYPPGPARYARSGTLVLPGFASRRDAAGFAMNILDPIDYSAEVPVRDAARDFTQKLSDYVGEFLVDQPTAYWLWHPIPNDPFLAVAQRQRPDLLHQAFATQADDEAAAQAVEAVAATGTASDIIEYLGPMVESW